MIVVSGLGSSWTPIEGGNVESQATSSGLEILNKTNGETIRWQHPLNNMIASGLGQGIYLRVPVTFSAQSCLISVYVIKWKVVQPTVFISFGVDRALVAS